MPNSSRYGLRSTGGLPRTLQRSCQQAQALFLKALEEAVAVYGDGDQACRAAYSTLKQEFEKRGDHWIAKTTPVA